MAQANTAQAAKYICLCSGARGQFFCIECEQYFCQTCRISHKKATVSKSHQLVEALKTESKDCEICLTKYTGNFYCIDCSQHFCSNCKTTHLRANVSKSHVFRDESELKKMRTSRLRSGNGLAKKKTNDEEIKKDLNKHDDMMTAKKIRQKCHDNLVRDITDAEIAYLKDVESNLPVQMTIDQVNGNITLYGILDDVMNAKQEVFDALRKFAHTRHCKAEAAIIKEQVQWYFKDLNDKGLPILTEYPDEINMYLETGYKGESGRKEVEFKDSQGEEYVIVLKDMMEYVKSDKTNKVEVLRREKIQDVKLIVHSKDTKSITAFYDEEKKRLPAPAHVPAQAHGHQKFASGDSSGSTQVVPKVLSDTEFQVGSVKLTVEKGDILSKKCGAIVNGTNNEFDLTKGAVSQALRKKCDAKRLDREVSKKKDEMKQYGYARTSGCGLPCDHIIHISSQHKPHEWKKIIKKALAKADKKQIKTMAFPALGTGAASTSEESMGQTIMEALVEFVSEGQTNLQHVFLVIFQDKMVKPMLKGVRSGGQSASTAKPGQVIKADNKRSTVTFAIYGISQRDIDNAKEGLKSAVKEKFKTEKIPDRLISEINEHEIAYLKDVESNLPVQMTIDQVNGNITLYGILDDVMNAKQEVFDALRKFAHTRHCKAEAAIIKEQVQWYFKDLSDKGLPILTEYPDEINMYLETGYKGESGRKEVEFKDSQGEEYVIVLKDMMEYVKSDKTNKVEVLRREKIQGDGGAFEPPTYWDDQGSENVKLVTLLPTSAEYTTLEQKFIQSVFSGRPEWANQFSKQTLKVTKIERIQNLSLYHMYAAKKALIEKQNPQGTKNEQELWHGTPDKAILSINMYGFNRSYCSDNSKDAWWGDGVYFSADASYSARNWLATGTGTGDHNIYLCNVLTGVSCQGKRGMRVLPVRPDGTMLNYDSATDAKYNPVVEYVIFNDTQAYPQYCIKFKY